MRRPDSARKALDRARAQGDNAILRSLWLAKAADHAIRDRAVLVGGTAVNLHTGSYRPTDVDMCAFLDTSDRAALIELGLTNPQGDHFELEFDDGELWLLEFPDTQVDGDISIIELSAEDRLAVISRESLIIDRLLQATDGTKVTFEEAVRLGAVLYQEANWAWVDAEIAKRDTLEPGLDLAGAHRRVLRQVRSLLDREH